MAYLIFKDFSRQSSKFKYFLSLCEPWSTPTTKLSYLSDNISRKQVSGKFSQTLKTDRSFEVGGPFIDDSHYRGYIHDSQV